MGDVLDIADKIEERHRNADKVKSSIGVIRKCFRFSGKYVGVMKKIADFVPDDVYGSVISGGFTLILGVGSKMILLYAQHLSLTCIGHRTI